MIELKMPQRHEGSRWCPAQLLFACTVPTFFLNPEVLTLLCGISAFPLLFSSPLLPLTPLKTLL